MATINGNSGNNTFEATLEAEFFNGLGGFDTVSYAESGEGVFAFLDPQFGIGFFGTAEGDTYSSIENLTGSNFGDTLLGDANDNIIEGGGGFDHIEGGAGEDRLRGDGNLFGGADNDTLQGGSLNASLFGGDGDDFLKGSFGTDKMDGGTGFDTVSYEGFQEGVSLNLSAGGIAGAALGDTYVGIEEILGTTFNDTIGGDDLANQIDGREGDDVLKGFGGNDLLEGSFGNDDLSGGAGNDNLFGGEGADILRGGADIDTVDYGRSDEAVNLNLGFGSGVGGESQGDTYESIEILFGSQFADKLGGDNLANQIFGDLGNDTLTGFSGDDSLAGDGGADLMIGGEGNDVYSVRDVGDVVNEVSTGGIDTVRSGIDFNLSNTTAVKGSVENLTLTGTLDIDATGNGLNNLLIGNSGDNQLSGNAGADTARGMGGNDVYFVDNAGDVVDEAVTGSGGIDEVRSTVSFSLSTNAKGSVENLQLVGIGNVNAAGNGLNNVIEGNSKINDLMGLGGNDELTGGLGADTFVFSAALNATTNVDTITDFKVVDDTMRLENAFMTSLSTGQLSASAFHIGASAADASDRIVYNSGTGALSYDADGSGSGAAIKFAELDTGLLLTSADFFVV